MSLSGEREEGTTASKISLSGERGEETTASKMTQDTSSKSVQKPRAESPTTSLLSMKSDQTPAFSQEPLQDDNKEVESLDSEDALKITHNLLDRRSQTLLTVQQDIKAKLKHKYQHISEGIGHHGNQSLFKDIYTELYITEGGSGGLNNEHEVRQIEMASKKQTTQETSIKCNDIFKPLPGQDKPIRTVLTKGIAGIGKTVSVQKVILDWAEGKANQDVHFMFPLPFRDLNLKKEQYSLMQLLSYYFSELKEIDSIEDGETKTVFIFDGLDECRLPLDFKNNEKCCDVTKPTSVDVLLTNLIKRNLLPSALLWVTSRPAAANQIPPECVDQVTEVRGFNDPQKEEYFRKKITDQNMANDIIKHMKTSRSLHIMCHMPVFCWISATVLEMILKEAWKDEVPKTLTQMYSHFILIQIIVKNRKYNKATETNPKELSQSDKEMILKLAKLAFQQLQKGNLIFYEEDLRECGLDVTEASEYSALCTEIFKEESGLYQEKVYSFLHLSIQEFLAAVHALESCLGKKENVFSPKAVTSDDDDEDKESIIKAVTSDDEEESIIKAVTSDDEEESIIKAVTSDDEEESIIKAITSYDEEESIIKAVTSDDEEESIIKAVTSDDEEESIIKAVTSYDEEKESIIKAVTSYDDDDYCDYGDDDYNHDEDEKDDEEESIQLSDLHSRAVDQALKSKNGHLDLFLRFLLGLSLESNQNLLRGLLTQTGSTTQTNEETVERTVEYLSDKIVEESSPERIINLFHCLNELGDNSLVEDMQSSLRSGTLSETRLKPDQCSALAYLLLMSEEVLEEFDLKTYTTSEEGYQRLLPVVKTCKRAL
ncbi:protein NLRC3-like [Salvelinus fontinalis]|uniref:protein NLRC3-like n=1 Tax=Salvelinus fontinalis TaxID=8038 RepID=UPI002486A276|nr:protein NLRC3-like [Salvelinus fontinalis]